MTVHVLFTSLVVLQSGVDLSNVKMSMNPFCEIAVEVSPAVLSRLQQRLLPSDIPAR